MTTTENEVPILTDAIALLCPAAVTNMIYIADDRLYDRAHREFMEATDVDVRQVRDAHRRALVESLFEEWLSYDRTMGDGADAPTPFGLVMECLHGTGDIDDRQLAVLRDIDRTNIASLFWVRQASAADRRIVLEDLVHGNVYKVRDAPIAAEWDGATGGAMIVRIAKAHGVWRLLSPPVVAIRGTADGSLRADLLADARAFHPHYLDLLRAVLAGDSHGLFSRHDARSGGSRGCPRFRPWRRRGCGSRRP